MAYSSGKPISSGKWSITINGRLAAHLTRRDGIVRMTPKRSLTTEEVRTLATDMRLLQSGELGI